MPGLDPGIQKRRRACRRRHWIAASSPAMTTWIKPDPFHCHARARPGHPETATRVQAATLDRRVKPGDDKVDKARPSPLSCPGSTRASRNGPRSCKRWGWIAGSSPAMTMGGDRTPCFVMPGLDPGIHSRLRMCKRWDWIAGSSPAMTREVARGGIVTSRLGVGLLSSRAAPSTSPPRSDPRRCPASGCRAARARNSRVPPPKRVAAADTSQAASRCVDRPQARPRARSR
jgi:hypothetical protein